jgi:hypothetical protein
MSTIAWIGPDGESHHHDEDVSREEFDQIRRRQDELMERVRFVESQVEALTARVNEDA